MKLLGKMFYAGPALLLLYAAPALAQFEVNPDHFDAVNLARPKPSVASKAARQHQRPRAAASRQLQAPGLEAQPATSSSTENAKPTSFQRHSRARGAGLSAKASANVSSLNRRPGIRLGQH